MHKIYIVLLNYNGTNDTIECLESLLKNNYENFQIIVIDNSENNKPLEKLINWADGKEVIFDTNHKDLIYPLYDKPIEYISLAEDELLDKSYTEKVVFVKAKTNNGFAAGNNIALNYIKQKGDADSYIWILNNDTILKKETIKKISEKIAKLKTTFNQNIDIIGTPLMEYENPELIQTLGGTYNEKTGLSKNIGENLKLSSLTLEEFEKEIIKVTFPIGASIIIQKNFIDKIGLLCEDYFLFYEELDWIYRLKEKGGKLYIINVFEVFHKQGKSTKAKLKLKLSKSEFIDLLFIRNRLLFAEKYNKKNLKWICFNILTLTILKRIMLGQISRVSKIIKIVFKYL